jgi:hypothetical protein
MSDYFYSFEMACKRGGDGVCGFLWKDMWFRILTDLTTEENQ